jgi:hypothetical protein
MFSVMEGGHRALAVNTALGGRCYFRPHHTIGNAFCGAIEFPNECGGCIALFEVDLGMPRCQLEQQCSMISFKALTM